MFTWCLYIRKKPDRQHCTCFQKTRRKLRKPETRLNEGATLDSCKETDPLLGERPSWESGGSATAAHSEVVVTPKLSVKARARQLLPFVGLFTPLVVFWAIFYQQSSTWVVQGRQMDCYFGRLHVPPGLDYTRDTRVVNYRYNNAECQNTF